MLSGRWSLDLRLSVGLALMGLLAAVLGVDPVIRTILLVPLVLFLPGYALCAVLLPPGTVQATERAVYSVAASIALTVTGAMLTQSLFSIDRTLWAVLLAAITIGLAIVAARRRGPAAGPPRSRAFPILNPRWPFMIAGLLAAAVLAAWSLSLASSGVHEEDERARFTALWILPAGRGSVSVGVSSHQVRPISYVLRVSQAGRPLRVLPLRLQPGEVREPTVSIAPIASGGTVEATLLHAGQVYRRTYLRRGEKL